MIISWWVAGRQPATGVGGGFAQAVTVGLAVRIRLLAAIRRKLGVRDRGGSSGERCGAVGQPNAGSARSWCRAAVKSSACG